VLRSGLLLLAGVLIAAPVSVSVANAAASGYSADPARTPKGTYRLSTPQSALMVKARHHNGLSHSLFRFTRMTGTLDWDPAELTRSKVDVTVEVNSITTNVRDFPAQLTSDRYLNVAKYPTASFVTTSAVRTGPRTGRMTGDLTLMGVTRPVTWDVAYVGGAPSSSALMNVGFTAVATIKRSDFGFSSFLPLIGDEITMTMDTEFAMARPPKTAAAAR
jgi:polyisoprenoid-binding protein YceI